MGMVRATMSIHAGISTPPVPVATIRSASSRARARFGWWGATKKATSASSRAGTRSHTLHRSTKGSLRGRASVCPAANSEGKYHPAVMTAGIAPISTLDAPRCWANAGRIVRWEASPRPTRKSA